MLETQTNSFDNRNDMNKHPYTIGDTYIIRTTRFTSIGTLVSVYPQELVLENASWIGSEPESYKYSTCYPFSDYSPYDGPVFIGRCSIIDCFKHDNDFKTIDLLRTEIKK